MTIGVAVLVVAAIFVFAFAVAWCFVRAPKTTMLGIGVLLVIALMHA